MTRKRIVLLMVAALLVAGGGTAAALVTAQTSTITMYFPDAQPLVEGNPIKGRGVQVGAITTMTPENGMAKVEATLDESILPLHTDASVKITQNDVLGERYVELDTGSPTAPLLPEPFVITPEKTERGVAIDEILNSVDTPSATAASALLTATGEGLKGQGKNAAGAIKALKPAMTQAGALSGILGEQNQVLRQLVDTARPVAQSVATERGQKLDRLVGSTTDTMGAVASRERKVQETLQQLPQTLVSARGTLARLAGVSDPTANTLQALRPLTNDLRDVSGELRRFSDAADPALASLPAVLQRADELLDEAKPLVKSLRPLGPDLRTVAPAARTLTEQALSLRLTNLLELVKGWTLATKDYDAISHYFKAIVVETPKSLGQAGAGPWGGAPVAPVPSLPIPGAPGSTPGQNPSGQPAPGYCSAPGGSEPRGEAPTDNNRGPNCPEGSGSGGPRDRSGLDPAGPDGSATGMRPAQEGAMFDQLLGGN